MDIKSARLALGAAACITASLAISVATQVSGAGPALTPSDKEAQRLFAVVLEGERSPGRCRYDLSWSREELPDFVAKSEFHLAVDAGLVPPSVTGDFRALVDPDHRINASAFCSDDDLKTYTAQRVGEFEKSSEPDMQIDRTTFDYPIFNLSRTKAAIVITHAALDGRFRMGGRIGRHPAGEGIEARIYKKIRGRWRLVRSTFFSVS